VVRLKLLTVVVAIAAICACHGAPALRDSAGERRGCSTFFGVSNGPDGFATAWVMCIDVQHCTGKMLVVNRGMQPVDDFHMDPGGRLRFRLRALSRFYRFVGKLGGETIAGTMQLVDARTGVEIWRAEVNAVAVIDTPIHYSNATYVEEGGDMVGAELWLIRTLDGPAGMIVFYEGYWGEPVRVPLAMSGVSVHEGAIDFQLRLPGQLGRYRLTMGVKRTTFNGWMQAGRRPNTV
jgi:hypothetical protein